MTFQLSGKQVIQIPSCHARPSISARRADKEDEDIVCFAERWNKETEWSEKLQLRDDTGQIGASRDARNDRSTWLAGRNFLDSE